MVKRIGRGIFLLTAACSLFGGIPVWASVGGPGVRKAEVDRIIKYESGIEIDRLKDAQDTDQIVVVLGTGMDNRSVGVAYFKKDEAGDWQEEFYVRATAAIMECRIIKLRVTAEPRPAPTSLPKHLVFWTIRGR